MSSIKIDILGTAAGVPTPERAHSAVHLSYNEKESLCLLFDCGEGTQRQLMKAGLNYMKIDHIFITHWHGDHCLGLPGLLDTMGFEGRDRPLSVYAPEEGMVDAAMAQSHSMAKFKIAKCAVPSDTSEPVKLFSTERTEIYSVPASHSVPAVSYMFCEKDKKVIDIEKAEKAGLPRESEIYKDLKTDGAAVYKGKHVKLSDISETVKGKKIVYSGDTEINDNLYAISDGADILIQDCTYFDKPEGDKHYKHASLPDIIKMKEEVDIDRVILTHISRKYKNTDELTKRLVDHQDFELAEDFMSLLI